MDDRPYRKSWPPIKAGKGAAVRRLTVVGAEWIVCRERARTSVDEASRVLGAEPGDSCVVALRPRGVWGSRALALSTRLLRSRAERTEVLTAQAVGSFRPAEWAATHDNKHVPEHWRSRPSAVRRERAQEPRGSAGSPCARKTCSTVAGPGAIQRLTKARVELDCRELIAVLTHEQISHAFRKCVVLSFDEKG